MGPTGLLQLRDRVRMRLKFMVATIFLRLSALGLMGLEGPSLLEDLERNHPGPLWGQQLPHLVSGVIWVVTFFLTLVALRPMGLEGPNLVGAFKGIALNHYGAK